MEEAACDTGKAIIQVSDAGQNAIILYEGANREMDRDFIEHVLAQFQAGDILVLQNEINLVPEIIESAQRRGLRIALNPSPANEVIHQDVYKRQIQAQLAAAYATDNLGCKKIGLFTNSNDYGTGARTVAEEYLTEKGIDFVTEQHNTGDTDMTSQVLKLKDAGVDCVIVWTDDAETALAARQFYDLGLDVPVIGSTSISTPQVNELCQPEWLDNWYSVTDFTLSLIHI